MHVVAYLNLGGLGACSWLVRENCESNNCGGRPLYLIIEEASRDGRTKK